MNKIVILLAFCIAFSLSMRPSYATDINNCTTIQSPGTYDLINNIDNIPSVASCILINNSDVIFDCHGYFLNGTVNTPDNLINVLDYDNITVKNCVFQGSNQCDLNYGTGIINISNEYVFNNTFIGDYDHLDFSMVINSLIENNTFYDSSDISIYNNIGGDNNTIRNNFISGSCFAFEFQFSDLLGTDIIYNNFLNSTCNNVDWTGTNPSQKWNTTRQSGTRIYSNGNQIGGNYWTNSTTNGYSDTCDDSNKDGFCDKPYDVGNNTVCAINDCGPNTDWLPLSDEYCAPDWSCTAWSTCVREIQTRECTDNNACDLNVGKPAESQSCYNTIPNASFNVSTSGCCPISLIYCSDNMTKTQLWNTSEGSSWASVACRFGCDNATSDCSPAPFESNLWILAIIFGIVVITALVIKWKRGR